MVLLLLAIAWAMILIPPAMRARAESRPSDSIVTFRRQLRVLQRTGPGAGPGEALASPSLPGAPRPVAASNVYPIRTPYSLSAARARTLKRRRDVLTTLMIGMSVTLVLGFMPGFRMAWALHLFLDAMFVLYVGLLINMRNRAAEREMKLRFLPRSAPAPQPALLLRRSAN